MNISTCRRLPGDMWFCLCCALNKTMLHETLEGETRAKFYRRISLDETSVPSATTHLFSTQLCHA